MAVGVIYLSVVMLVSMSWQAQVDSGSTNLSILIPSLIELTLADGEFFVDLGISMQGEDLEKQQANSLRVWTNSPNGWTLHIWTTDPDLGPLDRPDSSIRKPLEDFLWRSSGGQQGHLSQKRQLFAQGGANKAVDISADYFVDVKESDLPGDYGVIINYLVEINEP